MTTRIEEAKDWVEALSREPSYMKDEEGTEDEVLPATPTVVQLRSALVEVRFETNAALSEIVAEIESMNKELDKLRNHRHDFSKTFSGRAEF